MGYSGASGTVPFFNVPAFFIFSKPTKSFWSLKLIVIFSYKTLMSTLLYICVIEITLLALYLQYVVLIRTKVKPQIVYLDSVIR